MDKTNLISLGLNASEAEIYLTLLRMGKATSTKLTKETGIHRTYIYDVIEKLREKGLVSQFKENEKLHFQANSPENLKEYVNEKILLAEKIIPELNKIKKQDSETEIEVFRGKEGVKKILNDMINEEKDYFFFGTVKYFEDESILSKVFLDNWIAKVNSKKIKEKIIIEEGIYVTPIKKSEARYLPKEYLFFSSAIIYGDKTALFVWKEPFVQILIKNKDISKSYLTQFNILWNIAKSAKKKS